VVKQTASPWSWVVHSSNSCVRHTSKEMPWNLWIGGQSHPSCSPGSHYSFSLHSTQLAGALEGFHSYVTSKRMPDSLRPSRSSSPRSCLFMRGFGRWFAASSSGGLCFQKTYLHSGKPSNLRSKFATQCPSSLRY